MVDYKDSKYVQEMFWDPSHPGRPQDHWSMKNDKEWTPEEIEEFLKKELCGQDPILITGPRVLIKRPFPPKKIGSIILTDNFRKEKNREVTAGMVLDWGREAFTYKRTFPFGRTVNRGDWVTFKIYENTPVDMEADPGKEYDFELLWVYDEKISGVIEKFHDFYAGKR